MYQLPPEPVPPIECRIRAEDPSRPANERIVWALLAIHSQLTAARKDLAVLEMKRRKRQGE